MPDVVQTDGKNSGVGKVLDAAALTYVAALIGSILQLLWLMVNYAGAS